MATDIESLVEQANDVRRRLEERGALEDAQVVAQLIQQLTEPAPKNAKNASKAERPYYTVSEAAELIGVSGQTVKNWASRGMIAAYRLGNRIVIPRSEVDDYLPIAEAVKGIEVPASLEEIVEAVREGRRRFVWPVEAQNQE